MSEDGHGDTATAFEDGLERLGFQLGSATRRGGRRWSLPVNRYLEFALHDYHDAVVLTWSFALGDYVQARGWVLGTGERSFHDLYPAHDVRLEPDIEAVEAELRRVLGSLRLDLGDPDL